MKTVFKVNKDSDIYRKTVENRETTEKVGLLLKEFKEEIGAESKQMIYTYDFKTVGVEAIDKDKFSKSLCRQNKDGYYCFKKTSPIANRWQKMTKGLAFHSITFFHLISHDSIRCATSTCFDDDQNLYVIVKTDFPLKSYDQSVLEPITLSAFYKAMKL